MKSKKKVIILTESQVKSLMELYGVDRATIEDWRRNRGLKMIEVSTHSKYITEKDLLEWEEGLKGNYSDKGFNNQSVSERR